MSDRKLHEIIVEYEGELLAEWLEEMGASARRTDFMSANELREQCSRFLKLLQDATAAATVADIERSQWRDVKDFLADVSRSRGLQGASPTETATFVFSFKRPLFNRLRQALESQPDAMFREIWLATELIDRLGLYTSEVYQRGREEVITRQQEEMLELSTPVVQLWDGILALPMIGTLDSRRTQVVMETLLERIVATGSEVAIIDITGVPMVDTLVAQHLLKTVTAARLMGADCIISGIRPQIAQTIVHLGVELGTVTTKASLAAAFAVALERTGRAGPRPQSRG
jgi:rsbT co-antagonist protein RsbR